jgi:hypothetical protein
MKKILFLSFIFVLLIYSSIHLKAEIIMQPYLQAVSTDSIYILVECSSDEPVTVKYGTDLTYSNIAQTESTRPTTASPNTYVHRIHLKGLESNTLYHYKALHGSSSSYDYTFKTAVLPGTKFRLAWMADCRQGTEIHDKISKRIENENPAFLLYGGDLCSLDRYDNFKKEFFRKNELSLISKTPFFNTPGNHEGWSLNTKAFTQAPESGSGTQDYYSFDYGDLHILSINTELHRKPDSKQYKFVEQDLKNSTKPWKIVISHKPAYASGSHEDKDMQIMTSNIFENSGVDMVISAHSHYYQHNIVNGIHHMILGSSGAPLYWPPNAPYTKKSLRDYSFAIIDISPLTFQMKAYNSEGILLETIELKKDNKTI